MASVAGSFPVKYYHLGMAGGTTIADPLRTTPRSKVILNPPTLTWERRFQRQNSWLFERLQAPPGEAEADTEFGYIWMAGWWLNRENHRIFYGKLWLIVVEPEIFGWVFTVTPEALACLWVLSSSFDSECNDISWYVNVVERNSLIFMPIVANSPCGCVRIFHCHPAVAQHTMVPREASPNMNRLFRWETWSD